MLDLQYQFRNDLKNLKKKPKALTSPPKSPNPSPIENLLDVKEALEKGPNCPTRQSPKDPLPMYKAPQDTQEGHLSMYCQVRAVEAVEKGRGKKVQ